MKQVLYTFFYLLISAPLLAQSINPNIEVKNVELSKDVYALDHGTRGLLLVFEYKYSATQKRLTSVIPRITLQKNGMEVYLDEATILLLESDNWAKAQVFLPYRAINLLKGMHEEIQLNFSIENLVNYTTVFDYEQPLRYLVEIDLKGGSAKKKLKYYDQGPNAKEWLPDLYYVFATNGGKEPVYRSAVFSNTYDLKPQQFQFYILEGEQLIWSFYDRDGETDLELGKYEKINPQGEYTDEVYGQMFGSIRNLEFTFSQRAQSIQAISIYSNPNYLYKNKKGVAITIEYDLARVYLGKEANMHLNCYNKKGVMLDVPIFYPIDETPEIDAPVNLKVKGKLKYFIPFYVWEESCRDIEFYFELKNKEQINAARHMLLRPIEFDEWIIDKGMEVVENVEVQGAKGVQVNLNYELTEIYENAPLYIKFSNADGKKLPYPIYNILGTDVLVKLEGEQVNRNPRVADRLSYFIPYTSLNNDVITVQMDLVPDIEMNILKKNTQPLSGGGKGKDVLLELVNAGGRFRADNYGQVLEMKLEVPQFFLDRAKLEVQVKKNGKKSRAFLMDGMLSNRSDDFTLKQDSGRIYVIFPHRNIKSGNQFSLTAVVLNEKGDRKISNAITWSWKAPKDLFNRKIEVALGTCKFDKKIQKDTLLDRDFPWDYVVEAGGEVLVQEPLKRKLTNRELKEQFKQEVLVNREDNITVKLINKKNKQSLVLWNGDLGKWEQNNFKAEMGNKYPVKITRAWAKVDKDYKKNTDSGAL